MLYKNPGNAGKKIPYLAFPASVPCSAHLTLTLPIKKTLFCPSPLDSVPTKLIFRFIAFGICAYKAPIDPMFEIRIKRVVHTLEAEVQCAIS